MSGTCMALLCPDAMTAFLADHSLGTFFSHSPNQPQPVTFDTKAMSSCHACPNFVLLWLIPKLSFRSLLRRLHVTSSRKSSLTCRSSSFSHVLCIIYTISISISVFIYISIYRRTFLMLQLVMYLLVTLECDFFEDGCYISVIFIFPGPSIEPGMQ